MSSAAVAFYPGMNVDAAPRVPDASMATSDHTCAMCDKLALQECMLCHEFMYCGDECQQTHWVKHERECHTMHTTASPDNVGVMLPYDLVDSNGDPVSIKHSVTYANHSLGVAQTEYLDSPIGDLYGGGDNERLDIARRGGWVSKLRQARQERRELKDVPKLSRSTLSKQGPNEGIGVGRRPNENELNGTATLKVEHWGSYSLKRQNVFPQTWTLSVAVRGHCFYREAPEEQIQKIMEIRDSSDSRPGLALWFNVDAFEQAAEMILPTTGGYMEFTINTPGDTEQLKTQVVYPNLRYLRSGSVRMLKRSGFGSGLTARDQLTRKGLSPDVDFILSTHDKRSGKGIRMQMTVRVEDTVDMKVVDMEVYVPDSARRMQDTPFDADSPMRLPPPPVRQEISCDASSQEEIDGLVIALRTEIATIAQMMEIGGEDTDNTLKKDMDRVQRWLDVVAPHSVRLQAGNSPVEFGEELGPLFSAINESVEYLLVDGRLSFKSFGKGLKRKARQVRRRQYISKMRSEGIGWAERKAQRWKNDPSRLANLREAVATFQSKYLDTGDSDYARAQALVDTLPVIGREDE